MRTKVRVVASSLVLCSAGLFVWLSAGTADEGSAENLVSAEASPIELESIGPIELGPDGTLFVSDPRAAAIYAVTLPSAEGVPIGEAVRDLDRKIGSYLGIDGREVLVQDMAVDPRSGLVYLSVQRGSDDAAQPVLLSVDSEGEIRRHEVAAMNPRRLALPNAPRDEDRLYEWESRTFTVTDLEYIEGELFIAGLSNEEFASVLRRVPFPFDDQVRSTELEIFHGAHGEWETFAPIFSFVPYSIEGEAHLLAAYLCTPLVTFPLDEVRSKSRLRGKTIAELGWGNLATDIVPYQYGGEDYVLVVNNTRGTIKMKAEDIVAAANGDGITEGVGAREGVDFQAVPIGPVLQLADLDSDHVLILGRSLEDGSLYLSPRTKRRL